MINRIHGKPPLAFAYPNAPATNEPTKAATMPMRIVNQMGMCCRPGTTSLPRAPMTSPTRMAEMIPVIAMTLTPECVFTPHQRIPTVQHRQSEPRSQGHDLGQSVSSYVPPSWRCWRRAPAPAPSNATLLTAGQVEEAMAGRCPDG